MAKWKRTDEETLKVLTVRIADGAAFGRLSSHYPIGNCPPCCSCGVKTRGVVHLEEHSTNVGSICYDCFKKKAPATSEGLDCGKSSGIGPEPVA